MTLGDVQEFRKIDVDIQPRDRLVMHCVYDTSGDSVAVVGGDATNEEMCLTVLSIDSNVQAITDQVGGGCFSSPTALASPPDEDVCFTG